MARRSTTAASDADRTFPIRLKVKVPPAGLGMTLVEIDAWLRLSFEDGEYCQGPALAAGINAAAFHFMTINDAQAFLQAFPKLEMASHFVR